MKTFIRWFYVALFLVCIGASAQSTTSDPTLPTQGQITQPTATVASPPAVLNSTPDSTILSILNDAINSGEATKISSVAMKWLGTLICLQWFISNMGLLLDGADITQVLAKVAKSLAWFGICFYVVTNGHDFILNVGNEFCSCLARIV